MNQGLLRRTIFGISLSHIAYLIIFTDSGATTSLIRIRLLFYYNLYENYDILLRQFIPFVFTHIRRMLLSHILSYINQFH